MVMLFFVMLFLILTLITIITNKMMPYAFSEKVCSQISRPLLVFDVICIFGMALGYSIFRDNEIIGMLLQVISIFFMTQVIFSFFMIIALAVRKLNRRLRGIPMDKSKRTLVKGAAAFPVVAGALSLYGGLYERDATIVRNYDISCPGADNLNGFSIAQLSDVHLGPFFNLDKLRRLMDQAAATGADLLAITGDLFDDEKQNFQAAKIVNEYVGRFPKGIYFCWGNHEYIRNIQLIDIALSTTDIKLLCNSNQLVADGARPLYLAGADYPIVKDQFDSLKDLYTEKAMANLPDNAVKVLLAHHPDFIDNGAEYGAELVLTGHTHGCQIGIMGIPLVPGGFKYRRGMYQVGTTMGYVHSGNGSWFPIRIGCPPEIAVFTLRA